MKEIAAHIGSGKMTTTERLMEQIKEMDNVVIVDEGTNVSMQEPYQITNEYHKQFVELNSLIETEYGTPQTPKKWRGGENVPVGSEKKQGRNELCACGSGKKFKKCCDA